MSSPTDRARRRGARLRRRGRADYAVRGDRWAGAYLALDAVRDDLRRREEADE